MSPRASLLVLLHVLPGTENSGELFDVYSPLDLMFFKYILQILCNEHIKNDRPGDDGTLRSV